MWAHGMGYGMGWGMWVLILVGTIGFWLVVAYVVRAVIQGRPAPTSPTSSAASPTPAAPAGAEPLRLLDERLARGEIDTEEYQRIRALLTDGH